MAQIWLVLIIETTLVSYWPVCVHICREPHANQSRPVGFNQTYFAFSPLPPVIFGNVWRHFCCHNWWGGWRCYWLCIKARQGSEDTYQVIAGSLVCCPGVDVYAIKGTKLSVHLEVQDCFLLVSKMILVEALFSWFKWCPFFSFSVTTLLSSSPVVAAVS